MQQVDLTTLRAILQEFRIHWIPARLEQAYQCDRFTVKLALRTLQRRGWLTLSWHPQAARLGMGAAPPRLPDTFTFSQQLFHQVGGYALVAVDLISPWERVVDLQFAQRPQEPPQWHLYVEIMGKYSNVVLTTADQTIVTAAHQVGAQQSRVRTIQTGRPYEYPPSPLGVTPSLDESLASWRDRLGLIPAPLKTAILQVYRGVSSALVGELAAAARLAPTRSTETLTDPEWGALFEAWRAWLTQLEQQQFRPGWLADGTFTVLGWQQIQAAPAVQAMLEAYYTAQLAQQTFQHLRHQLLQRVAALLKKLHTKAEGFRTQQSAAEQADGYRQRADLLMAHLYRYRVGMTHITLPDFETEQPVQIPLDPERNAVQNAQALYKRHQKLRRSRDHVQPLLAATEQEIDYLTQVQAAIETLDRYSSPEDLQILEEIRAELIQQGYVSDPNYLPPPKEKTDFYRYKTPNGGEVWVGRNNQQNEALSFRVAGAYDLWFHAQEIPGSHVLLRLGAGQTPEESDLNFAANLAAYYSRARHSSQVPVVWTAPKHVYKPKGAKPGMVVYKQEQVVWGNPQAALAALYPHPEPPPIVPCDHP